MQWSVGNTALFLKVDFYRARPGTAAFGNNPALRRSARAGPRLPAEDYAKIVRPQHDRQDSLPESQVQKPDGKEPGGNPDSSHKTLLLDLDFLHALQFTPGGCQDRSISSRSRSTSERPAGEQAPVAHLAESFFVNDARNIGEAAVRFQHVNERLHAASGHAAIGIGGEPRDAARAGEMMEQPHAVFHLRVA